VGVCECAHKVSVFLLAHVDECREHGQVFGDEIHSRMQKRMQSRLNRKRDCSPKNNKN